MPPATHAMAASGGAALDEPPLGFGGRRAEFGAPGSCVLYLLSWVYNRRRRQTSATKRVGQHLRIAHPAKDNSRIPPERPPACELVHRVGMVLEIRSVRDRLARFFPRRGRRG